jgi:hypothetical protein
LFSTLRSAVRIAAAERSFSPFDSIEVRTVEVILKG